MALVAVAVAVPVFAVLGRALRPDGAWSLDAVDRILSSGRTWRLLGLTVGQALVSTLLTAAVGLPLAWVLARYRFAGRGLVRTAAMVPFVLPSVVLGSAIASVLGPSGLVDARGTWWPVFAAHVCFNLAVFVRVVGAALDGLDPSLEDTARTLGTTPAAAARRVLVPAVAPAVWAAAIVVFLFCLTSFGVIVILGGGSVSTVEVEIWVRATRQFDLSGAAVLAGLQVLAVVATLALHARFSRRAARPVRSGRRWSRRPATAGERAQVALAVLAVGIVTLVPLGALVERSLRLPGGGHGLDHWRHLGEATAGTGLTVSPWDAVAFSLVSAVLATAFAVLVGVPAARVAARRPGGAADRILLLPLGVSATTIGLGILLAVGRPPVDLRRAWWLVPAAQALVAVPLLVRAVAAALRDLPPSVTEVAATLGAGPRRRWWRVELPMVRGAVVAGAGLAFVASLGEFGATVFLARADRPTVPVAIERLMSRPGSSGFGQAMALSCILVLLCGVVLAIVDRSVDALAGRRGARVESDAAGGIRLGL
ncbi:ABC transporter permease [Dermatobacter hominis]|uniref:ABC transporter permease n=1 Tax=Dermatobacter hominis TaxID=2884263 RepID=UPI001D0FCB38|nr:iron ABC transporter permease [Dermatobacter hominis]UDY36129.1 iron ABC transporter permease [Dermatobacter hominis]